MVSARQVMKAISKAAWVCGDPGLQYDTIINDWNPVLDTLRINASNPCCFVGDTLVETSEGPMTMRALQELSAAGKPLPLAFSYDLKIGMPVLRQIKRAWIAGKTSDIVSVVTQRGLSFECTPEHRFLTYDGDYIQAKDLAEGTRLRKVAFTRNEQRSNRLSIMHKTTDDSPNGCTYLSRWMWEQVHGSVPEGFEVHHQDGSAWNDKLSNFELVEGSKHRSLHSRGKGNPRFIECSLENLVEVWEAIEQSEKRTHRQLPKVSIARWNSYVRKNSLQGKVPIASSKGEGRIQGRPWPLFEEAVREHQEKVNDRILSVTPAVSKEVEVFDIEVEETNNFCITTRVIHGHDGIVETARPLHSIVVHNSEYMYIDDSACNLASINLLKFFTHDKENGPSFNEQLFEEACQVIITAQEIFVGFADYPTKKIEKNSHAHRPLGLGFCNLGALLMAYGLPYDSEEGRALASAITSLMSAAAYEQSSKIAAKLGPFEAFEANRKSFSKVIAKHLEANNEIVISPRIAGIRLAAKFTWERVLEACRRGKGVRNGQISVLAPTGTISFIMDADTTGIEPDIALVKYKTLVGGGTMKLVNGVIPLALKGLGYHEDQIKAITHYINQEDTIEGAPFLKETDLPIFDCAFKAENGIRFIKPEGHLKMMAACQPFISGAISKTVNMPNSATEEEIERTYVLAWKLGLKCVALYRDGCKRTQPLSVKKVEDHALSSASLSNQSLDEPVGNPLSPGSLHPVFDEPLLPAAPRSTGMGKDTGHRGSNQPVRRRLPNDRVSLTHKFSIGGHEGYLTIGFYADGLPGEIFIRMNKEGSTISGLMDTIAILTSLGLQYGVPIETLSDKLAHTQYEPRGMTDNQEIPFATSIPDYLFRFLQAQYGEEARKAKAQPELPMKLPEKSEGKSGRPALSSKEIDKLYEADEKLKKGIDKFALTTTKNGKAQDATRICPNCGSLMQWAGRCMACPSCGTSGGCG
jgi:ribonucleotide reductase alpha subunit